MNNTNFNNNLLTYKDPILNYFNANNFHLHFLNKQKTIKGYLVPSRAKANGAHIMVQSFSDPDNNGWVAWANPKYYYVTFNTCINSLDRGFRAFTLRKDLLTYWSDKDISDLSVLVVSTAEKAFYEVKATVLLENFAKRNYKVLNEGSPYESATFSLNGLAQAVPFNTNSYVPHSPKSFDDSHYTPQFISNFTYSVYRQKTPIVVHQYHKGVFDKSHTFRSIKEVFDLFSKNGYNKSYKSLQRAAVTEEIIILGDWQFYISKDLTAAPLPELTTEKKVKTVLNPLFDSNYPADETNPKELIVKEWNEYSKADKEFSTYEEVAMAIDSTYEEKYIDEEKDTMVENDPPAVVINEIDKHFGNEWLKMKQQLKHQFEIVRNNNKSDEDESYKAYHSGKNWF